MNREQKIDIIYDNIGIKIRSLFDSPSMNCKPIMIWDILQIYSESTSDKFPDRLIDALYYWKIWWNYRTPIDSQPDECIDYIYNLIK